MFLILANATAVSTFPATATLVSAGGLAVVVVPARHLGHQGLLHFECGRHFVSDEAT